MTYDELHKQLDEEYDRIIAETLRRLRRKKPLTREKIAKALFKANKAYWTARLALLDDDAVVEAERVARVLAVPYAHAAEELSDQVRRVFSGYQSAFNLTQKEAEDLFEHVVYDRSVADNLRTMAAAVTDSEEKTRIMAELSAPAYRYRMQRAEQIAKNAQETLESIARNEVRTDRAFMQTEIEKAYNISLDESQLLPPSDAVIIDLSGKSPQNTGYMPRSEEPVRDFAPTTDRGIMDSFTLVNDKAVKEIIDYEWKDGNFSERIWSNTDELAREVKQVLLEGELTGASEAKMAAKIEERFHVGMYKARRVVRTESNYCINQAELKGMKDAGFDEYEFISLGENAEDVCDTCDDLDGERFKISEAAVGVNCPPMHPFCRCKVTTPLRTEADIQADIDRLLNGMSMEELANRLEALAEKREALPESDSTLNSAQESTNSAEENSVKMSVNEIGRSDVTDEYIEKAMPGTGLLTHDAGCEDGEHEDELKFAEWVHNTLGGDIHVRKEANQQNVKDPDYMWNGKLWDLKTVSTEKAANTAVQRGIDQIKHNPGGVMLDYNTNHVNLSTLELILDRRMKWYHDITADIMVVSNNEVVKVYRYKR